MTPGRRIARRLLRGLLLFVISSMPDPRNRDYRIPLKERFRMIWRGGAEQAGMHWDRIRDKPKDLVYGVKNARRELTRWVDDLKDDLDD